MPSKFGSEGSLRDLGDTPLSLVVEARAPEGSVVGEEITVSLPAGGYVVVRCPVAEGAKFRVVVSPSDVIVCEMSTSEVALLQRELEGGSSDEEIETSAVPIERVLSSVAPYFLDLLQQSGDDGRLVLLYLECEQHKKMTASHGQLRSVLENHERSVYESYVAPGAPKFACQGIPRAVTAKLAKRYAKKAASLDAFSELSAAVKHALTAKWYPRFLVSDGYKRLLRDSIVERDKVLAPPKLDDLIEGARARRCRRVLHAFVKTREQARILRWWLRLEGRLRRLCESPTDLDATLAPHVTAELRGASHRLIIRPPLKHKELLERLSSLYKSPFQPTAAMYASIFSDWSHVLRDWLETNVWRPFLTSTAYGELAAAELQDREPMAAAVELALRQSHEWWNPVFLWSPSQYVVRLAKETRPLLRKHRPGCLLLAVDSATNDEDDLGAQDSDEDDDSPVFYDDEALALALVTLCDERRMPELVVALLLEVPVDVKSTDDARRRKSARRICALADALPYRRARCRVVKKDSLASCRVFDDDEETPLVLDVDTRQLAGARHLPPSKPAKTLVKALRSDMFKTLQSLDGDTPWRKPLDVYGSNAPVVNALHDFVDAVFVDHVRFFATRHSEAVVVFNLAAFFQHHNDDLDYYDALFSSRRFADALVEACFYAPPISDVFSWVLPRSALDVVADPDPIKAGNSPDLSAKHLDEAKAPPPDL